jgi:tripartite-type tricarboxylate transporter receptor subunit TctC
MVKDFAPVTLLATTPNLLVIHSDVPAKTLAEFIALGKREGKMTFASAGSGTSIHVSGELFKTMTGIDMTHVPYKGRASAIPDLLGGRVTMMFDNMPSSLPLVREGRLRALGVTSLRRSPAAPEIPTIAEQGLPGFEAVSWFALFAPAGTPQPVIDRLQGEVKKIHAMPELARKLAEIGLDAIGSTPD